jgi:hypothetical protein
LHKAQFLDFGFKLGNGLLEIEKIEFLRGHSVGSAPSRRPQGFATVNNTKSAVYNRG